MPRVWAERESKADAGVILTSARILSSMHVDEDVAQAIFNKVCAMEMLEGDKFIMNEGAVKYARTMILEQGERFLRTPAEK